jgi:hypothetical protein
MLAGALQKWPNEDVGPRRGATPKQSMADVLVNSVLAAGISLFHDENSSAFMTLPAQVRGAHHVAVQGQASRDWIRHLAYQTMRKAVPSQTLRDVMDTLAAVAQHEGEQCTVYLRVGGQEGAVYFDLGRDDGAAVEILPSGWAIRTQAPIKLVRSPGFGGLPDPVRGGSLGPLRELLGHDQQTWLLIIGFIVNALRPSGPYFCMTIEGEQGSGKSVLSSIVKKAIDPNAMEKAHLPHTPRDLLIQAKEQYLLVYDNVSGMDGDMSDALSSLVTGGGLSTRRLYTNDELQTFNFSRPVIINGIAEFVTRPDLLQRAIPLNLPSIESKRRSEAAIYTEFKTLLPAALGCLFDAISLALKAEHTVEVSPDIRMVDAAKWITAAEPALGLVRGTIVEAILEAQDAVTVDRMTADPVVLAIERIVAEAPFEGTVGTLYEQLATMRSDFRDRQFPASSSHLSRRLKRLKPPMERVGIFIDFGVRGREGKRLRVWRKGQEEMVANNRSPNPAY